MKAFLPPGSSWVILDPLMFLDGWYHLVPLPGTFGVLLQFGFGTDNTRRWLARQVVPPTWILSGVEALLEAMLLQFFCGIFSMTCIDFYYFMILYDHITYNIYL